MEISQEQVQSAAKAGLAVLEDDTLRVPMPLASDGTLNLLRTILRNVAVGGVVMVDPRIHERGLRAIEDLSRLQTEEEKGDGHDN